MQASKIMPDMVYAIEREATGKLDNLVRFQVNAVITRRETAHGNPHDYKSKVEGHIIEDHVEGKNPKMITIDPKQVLGPFEQYAELVERKKVEAELAKRKHEQDKAETLQDRLDLYAFVGKPALRDSTQYGQLFRVSGYSDSQVDVSKEGVKALVERIRGERK